MTTPVGAAIEGRWEVVETLGRGAFGHTLLARDRETDQQVAIKVLEPRKALDLKTFQLFEREASVLRSLRHQGIPQVFDTFRAPWQGHEAALLVMEYIDGVSLARVIEAKDHLDPAAVLQVLVELLGILDYLHGRVPPVLHRDIKPANIIVRPNGYPALVDFGSVRAAFKAPDETGSTVAGTYGYMPYEQYMGQATPASDLYAVGATFLHLLTGRAPPEFMSTEGRIEVPANLPGDPRLRAVIARMLKPSPAERFQSAREVRDALLAVPGGGALVPAARGAVPAPAGAARRVAALPDAPRPIGGDTKELYQRVAPGMWDLMTASEKPTEGIGLGSLVAFLFFSVLTAGIMPVVFFSIANERRRRLKVFFRKGVPALATIQDFGSQDMAFGEKLAKVSYEFTADGELHRDTDVVLPSVAGRWRVGEQVQVLYLPERNYDSVIISP